MGIALYLEPSLYVLFDLNEELIYLELTLLSFTKVLRVMLAC